MKTNIHETDMLQRAGNRVTTLDEIKLARLRQNLKSIHNSKWSCGVMGVLMG